MSSGCPNPFDDRSMMRLILISVLTLFLAPITWRAMLYWRGPATEWWSADRSSAGLLPKPSLHPEAAVRIFAARTVSWRGIVAVHSWIVLKDAGASAYQRFDLTAWGDPIRIDGFDPDGRWFGQVPDLVFAADGTAAERLLPRMRDAIRTYRYRNRGDYKAWPGPNSNTFVEAVLAAVPECGAVLPPTAIGKDFPLEGGYVGLTPSRTGFWLSLGGYLGVTVGWIEGLEFNILGGVIGLDLRHPAIKLPAIGRIGWPTSGPEARVAG